MRLAGTGPEPQAERHSLLEKLQELVSKSNLSPNHRASEGFSLCRQGAQSPLGGQGRASKDPGSPGQRRGEPSGRESKEGPQRRGVGVGKWP